MAQNHMADDGDLEGAPDPLRTFNEYRSLLFSIAYRMLGTVADAEDMLQSRSSAGYASITCSPLVRSARNTSASGCQNRW